MNASYLKPPEKQQRQQKEDILPSETHWYIIGGVTLLCITVAGIGSMIARSEAEWENIRERQR